MVELYPNTTVTMVKNMLLGHNNVTIKNAKSIVYGLDASDPILTYVYAQS